MFHQNPSTFWVDNFWKNFQKEFSNYFNWPSSTYQFKFEGKTVIISKPVDYEIRIQVGIFHKKEFFYEEFILNLREWPTTPIRATLFEDSIKMMFNKIHEKAEKIKDDLANKKLKEVKGKSKRFKYLTNSPYFAV